MCDRLYPFHLFKDIRCGNGSRSLFYDFLMSSLHRAVSTKQGNGIAVLICQDLDLEMTSMLCQLHDKNRRARNFCLYLEHQIEGKCLAY